jgi:hypothetical protein
VLWLGLRSVLEALGAARLLMFRPGIFAKFLRLNPRTEMTSTALYTKTRHQFVTKTVNFQGVFQGCSMRKNIAGKGI